MWIHRRPSHKGRQVSKESGADCGFIERDCRTGSLLRALSRQLQQSRHVHAGHPQRSALRRRCFGGNESPRGPHNFTRRVRHHSCRLPDRIWLSRARDSTKAGRMASACIQHNDGAAHFCAPFIRNERIPRFGGFVLETRGIRAAGRRLPVSGMVEIVPEKLRGHEITVVQDLREGRFQKHLALATAASAFFSGIEALYSHYKNNFKYKAQWSPIVISALLIGAALGRIRSPKVAKKLLPAVSALAIADGAAGFYYHARGVARRPGGLKHPVTTSCLVLQSLLRCFLRHVDFSAYSPACSGGNARCRLQRGSRRPVDPKTGEPLNRNAQPGYYPGFSTLSQKEFWDEATRKIIVARVERNSSYSVFLPRRSAADDRGLRSHPPARRSRRLHKIPIVNCNRRTPVRESP